MSEKLLTVKEAAEYLGISAGEVNNLAEQGKIPAYKVGGVFLRFKKEQLNFFKDTALLAKRRTGASSLDQASPEDIAKQTFLERIGDFIHFNDFYILCVVIIGALLYIILKRG